jgi:DNA-binding transcriptional ArsR family regulator
LFRCSDDLDEAVSRGAMVEEPVFCEKGDEDLRCDVQVVNPERVAAVRRRLIGGGEAEQVADVFKILGDPSRCRLVFALIEAAEICVCDLAATLEMSESNVSHHLRVLRSHGLVRYRREGKMVYYSPDDEHIRLLLDLTRDHVAHRADVPAAAVAGPAAGAGTTAGATGTAGNDEQPVGSGTAATGAAGSGHAAQR